MEFLNHTVNKEVLSIFEPWVICINNLISTSSNINEAQRKSKSDNITLILDLLSQLPTRGVTKHSVMAWATLYWCTNKLMKNWSSCRWYKSPWCSCDVTVMRNSRVAILKKIDRITTGQHELVACQNIISVDHQRRCLYKRMYFTTSSLAGCTIYQLNILNTGDGENVLWNQRWLCFIIRHARLLQWCLNCTWHPKFNWSVITYMYPYRDLNLSMLVKGPLRCESYSPYLVGESKGLCLPVVGTLLLLLQAAAGEQFAHLVTQ